MTGDTIAIAGSKGGVGKTTTTINLAAGLRMVSDWSVAAVDLDLAMANFLDFLALDIDADTGPTLHDVLAGRCTVLDAVYEGPGGISVVPSGSRLQGYAESDPGKIREALDALRAEFDIVLLDTAAGVSYETVLPLGLADGIVLVTTPRLAAVRDTEKTKLLADRVEGNVLGVIFVRSGTGKAPGVEKLADFLGVDLLGHVPEDEVIAESQDAGQPILVYDFASKPAKAYWDAAQSLSRKIRGLKAQPTVEESATHDN